MSKKKESTLMRNAKDTIALGTINTLGTYAFGRVGANHPVTQPTTNSVIAGLQITQVGQTAKNAMGLVDMFRTDKKKKKDSWY